ATLPGVRGREKDLYEASHGADAQRSFLAVPRVIVEVQRGFPDRLPFDPRGRGGGGAPPCAGTERDTRLPRSRRLRRPAAAAAAVREGAHPCGKVSSSGSS